MDKNIQHGKQVFGVEALFQEEAKQVKDNSDASILLEDPEIKAMLDEYGLDAGDYITKDSVIEVLDEIANDWLMNDLSEAEAKDLAEPDAVVRNAALNAKPIKEKIYNIELKLQKLDPEYKPSVYEPMKVGDWNPPRNTSPEDFYKVFAYYFGDEKSKIEESANLYVKFHPDANIEDVKRAMARPR